MPRYWQLLVALIVGSGVISCVAVTVTFVVSARMWLRFGKRSTRLKLTELVRGEWDASLSTDDRVFLQRYRLGLCVALTCATIGLLALLCAVVLRHILVS
jgi:predicted RND superfamily exporter protein